QEDVWASQQTATWAVSSTSASIEIVPGDRFSKSTILSPLTLLLNGPPWEGSLIMLENPQSLVRVSVPFIALQRLKLKRRPFAGWSLMLIRFVRSTPRAVAKCSNSTPDHDEPGWGAGETAPPFIALGQSPPA